MKWSMILSLWFLFNGCSIIDTADSILPLNALELKSRWVCLIPPSSWKSLTLFIKRDLLERVRIQNWQTTKLRTIMKLWRKSGFRLYLKLLGLLWSYSWFLIIWGCSFMYFQMLWMIYLHFLEMKLNTIKKLGMLKKIL